MKESEARKKWCPHVRVVFGFSKGTTEPFNRFVCDPADEEAAKVVEFINKGMMTKCVGSDCMMWAKYGDESGNCGLKTRVGMG